MDLDYNLLAKNENPKIAEFIQTYQLWQAYFERVHQTDTQNPNIQKLNANIKLMIICGYSEDLLDDPKFINNKLDQSFQKYLHFFNKLSYEEKFYFNLSHKLKKINQEADRIYEKLNETGDEKLLKRLLKIQEASRKVESENYKLRIIDFLKDDTEKIDKEFRKRLNVFYGLRSVLVHEGKPLIIAGTGGTNNLYMGIYDNKFYSSSVEFEAFFHIAVYRNLNLPISEVNIEIIKFLQGEPMVRYPVLTHKVIEKLKSSKPS